MSDRYVVKDFGTVPCKFCAAPTRHTETKMCDNCWEVHRRIKDISVEVLKNILNDTRDDIFVSQFGPLAVFAGDFYYPVGGFGDFIGYARTREEAKKLIEDHPVDWSHIADLRISQKEE